MDGLPAICKSCGQLFTVRGLIGGNATIQIDNCVAGPCPSCGGSGPILDGTYSLAQAAYKLLRGPKATFELVAKLESILEKAQSASANPESIRQEIRLIPDIGDELIKLMPSKKSEWYVFIGLLITLITLIYDFNQPQPLNEEQMARAVQRGIEAAQESSQKLDRPPAESRGRNKPCYCNSGKKYKNCCGRDDLSPAERLLRDFQNSRKNPDYDTGGYRT